MSGDTTEPMAGWTRRRALQLLGFGLLAVASGCRRRPSLPPERARLEAAAEAVLPSVVGPTERAAVVDEHLIWVRGYEPGRRRRGRPAAPRYAPAHYEDDLARLERLAVRRQGRRFDEIPVDDRRALLEHDVASAPQQGADPAHVALALLWCWYRTPAAHNHCVGARVDPRTPRPLDGSIVAPRRWP
jgi:hypothetical protein